MLRWRTCWHQRMPLNSNLFIINIYFHFFLFFKCKASTVEEAKVNAKVEQIFILNIYIHHIFCFQLYGSTSDWCDAVFDAADLKCLGAWMLLNSPNTVLIRFPHKRRNPVLFQMKLWKHSLKAINFILIHTAIWNWSFQFKFFSAFLQPRFCWLSPAAFEITSGQLNRWQNVDKKPRLSISNAFFQR